MDVISKDVLIVKGKDARVVVQTMVITRKKSILVWLGNEHVWLQKSITYSLNGTTDGLNVIRMMKELFTTLMQQQNYYLERNNICGSHRKRTFGSFFCGLRFLTRSGSGFLRIHRENTRKTPEKLF
jgi:hypothetical protein